jgi:uncharacterized membrane protein YcaP (DUF421 family)
VACNHAFKIRFPSAYTIFPQAINMARFGGAPEARAIGHNRASGGNSMPDWAVSHAMWHDIFVTGVPVLEKVLRPIIVYIFLVVLLRAFGKRELAQLNPFDLVVLLSLSNTVQNAIIGNDNSITGGLISAFTLLAVNYLVVRFLFRHRRLDQIFEGQPTILVEGGHIVKHALSKELLTRSELKTELHRQCFAGVVVVVRCVFEPGGTFYIQRKMPAADQVQHAELIDQLRQIHTKLDRLLAPGGAAGGPV